MTLADLVPQRIALADPQPAIPPAQTPEPLGV
jgi:hypothetical protein